MTDTAKQYALAVFSLALEKKELEELSKDLKKFVDGIFEDTEKFFRHPKITKIQKKELIDSSVHNKLLANFLKVVIDNDRFDLINPIYYEYLDLLNNMNNIMEVTVFTAKSLSKENKDKIKSKIGDNYHRKVKIIEKIDKNILGGIRIEYEGKVIDNTVNRYLTDLKSALKE